MLLLFKINKLSLQTYRMQTKGQISANATRLMVYKDICLNSTDRFEAKATFSMLKERSAVSV